MEGPVPIGLNWTVHQLLYNLFSKVFSITHVFSISLLYHYYMCAMYVDVIIENKTKKTLKEMSKDGKMSMWTRQQ